jgi:hypothetical protein
MVRPAYHPAHPDGKSRQSRCVPALLVIVDRITGAPGAIPACLVDPVPNLVTDPTPAQVRLWRLADRWKLAIAPPTRLDTQHGELWGLS